MRAAAIPIPPAVLPAIMRVSHALLALLLAALLTMMRPASAQLDTATGHIVPSSSSVPAFNPEDWNRAYKLELRNVPRTSRFCSRRYQVRKAKE